jgi:hypothetical protein
MQGNHRPHGYDLDGPQSRRIVRRKFDRPECSRFLNRRSLHPPRGSPRPMLMPDAVLIPGTEPLSVEGKGFGALRDLRSR